MNTIIVKVGRAWLNLAFVIRAIEADSDPSEKSLGPDGINVTMFPGEKLNIPGDQAGPLRAKLDELASGQLLPVYSATAEALQPQVHRPDPPPPILRQTE